METEPQRKHGRRWPRRSLRVACAVAVAVAVAAAVLKYWLGPHVLAGRVRGQLARVWEGPVTIERVAFAFTAPSTVHGLELADRAGRRWVRVETASLTLEGLAGGDPKLAGVDLAGVQCEAHLTDGRLDPPWRRGDRQVDLRSAPKRVTVTGIRLRGPEGAIVDDAGITLTLHDGQGLLEATISTPAGRGRLGPMPLVYEPSGRKLSIEKIEGLFVLWPAGEDGGFWRRRLGGIGARGVIRLRGGMDYDADRPEPWQGAVELNPEELAVVGPGRRAEVVSDIRWDRARITPSRVEVTQLTGKAGGGTVTAEATMDNWADASGRVFDAVVSAEGVDLAAVADAASPGHSREVTGKADLTVLVHGRGFGWEGVTGRGNARVTGVDLWSVPVVSAVFEQMKLAGAASALSEAQCVFELAGPEVRIGRAVVTNPLAGIECTGGTVDLRTGQVDVVVVGGTFLTLNRFTDSLGASLRSKLLGHRIRGRYDQIGPKDFIPLPAAKIADSSVELLRSLSRQEGGIGKQLQEMLDGLFKGLAPAGAATQTAPAP